MTTALDKTGVSLLTLGDSAVGKSSLLCAYTEAAGPRARAGLPEVSSTIGIDFRGRTATLPAAPPRRRKELQVRVRVWDTAGQERFRSITQNYYRGAHGVLLVCDLANRRSFESVSHWMRDIEQHGLATVQVVLAANKRDLPAARREVSADELQELRLRYPRLCGVFETSACTREGVEEAFACLVAAAYDAQHGTPAWAATPAQGDATLTSEAMHQKAGRCCATS